MAKICPLLKKACIESKCEWWIHLLGSDPQTGQPKDEFGCVLRWMPVLLTENATMIRRAGASSDKTATEVARLHGTLFASMPEEARHRIMQANPRVLLESDANSK